MLPEAEGWVGCFHLDFTWKGCGSLFRQWNIYCRRIRPLAALKLLACYRRGDKFETPWQQIHLQIWSRVSVESERYRFCDFSVFWSISCLSFFFGTCSSSRKVTQEWLWEYNRLNYRNNAPIASHKTITASTMIRQLLHFCTVFSSFVTVLGTNDGTEPFFYGVFNSLFVFVYIMFRHVCLHLLSVHGPLNVPYF